MLDLKTHQKQREWIAVDGFSGLRNSWIFIIFDS